MVSRVRPFLDDFIGPLQSSFIPNRGTTDNALIAQEIVHFMHKKKGKAGYLIFKIDFEKAYDRVDWHFLKLTLQEFGFPSHIINLIMSCTTSSTLSPKWNNEKLESFVQTRGLRQGDPLSPYLFVLCMEKLALMTQEKVNNKQWLPIKISKNGPPISHLFFADDCLLFTKAKASQVRLVKDILHYFCLASGMKVNVQKSRFLPSKNVTRSKISQYEGIIDFHHTYNIGRYLGFPLLAGRVTKSDFSFILDKINSRLAGWKAKLLSRAGRVTLAKSVLCSMPIYTMQNLWLPEGVCDNIDSCIRRFIWGSKAGHWVKWSKVTQPKNKGGLGFHRTRVSNISLLGKHVWSLLHHHDRLWVKLLSSKYLKDNDILHCPSAKGASYTWKSILKACGSLHSGFITRIGKGNLSLWYDKWLDKGRLCDLVPFVDIHATNMCIRDIYHNGEWHFEELYTSLPTDIQLLMKGLFINDDAEDIVIWGPLNSRTYSTKSAHSWLDESNNSSIYNEGRWSWIWKCRVPENLRHFL